MLRTLNDAARDPPQLPLRADDNRFSSKRINETTARTDLRMGRHDIPEDPDRVVALTPGVL
jgi:hypothetical protein